MNWYYAVGQDPNGPHSTRRIQDLIHEGKIHGKTLVWREGMSGWAPLDSIEEFNTEPVANTPTQDKRTAGEIPEVTDEAGGAPHQTTKKRWAFFGGFGGLVLFVAAAVADWRLLSSASLGVDLLSTVAATAVVFVLVGAAAGFLAGLFRDAAKNPSAARRRALESTSQGKTVRYTNVVARHWRGEYPLVVSYWGFGFLGNIAIAMIPWLTFTAFQTERSYYPPTIFAALLITWTGVACVAIWQLVGIWRSANIYKEARRSQNRSSFWGVLAQMAVILGLLGSAGTLVRDGVPQVTESYRIAFQNDPDLPPYSIRVLASGTEAEISGGFKYGLARDFETILRASPEIRIVHLRSAGGRLGEGVKLFNLFRAHGLDTFVSSQCLSACTLAFAGGGQRVFTRNALLGFHKGAFAGVEEDGFDSIQRDVFVSAGFSRRFIDKALSTPHSDMWTPGIDELLSANVVTRISRASSAALPEKKEFVQKLAQADPLFTAIRSRFPEKFDALASEAHRNLVSGKPELETLLEFRKKFLPLIHSLLPLADDDVLVEMARILVAQYSFLNSKNPTDCYEYGSKGVADSNKIPSFPAKLGQRELNVQTRVVQTAQKRPAADKEVVEALWDKVADLMLASGVTMREFTLLESTELEPREHRRYCEISIQLYKAIAQLPQSEAAVLIREIFSTL